MDSLEDYRLQIHEIDRQILTLIKNRLDIGIKVSEVKKTRDLPIIDANAETATMDNLITTAATLGVDGSLAKRLGTLLIGQTIEVQNANISKQSKDQLLKRIVELTQQMLLEGVHVTRFEIGEPNFPPPRQVIRELSGSFRKSRIIGYGSATGLPELRTKLAEELSNEHHVRIDPEQVLITPGARFGIFATVTSFVSELERVIIPQPAFPAYEECVSLRQGRTITVNSSLEDNWDLDLAKLEEELQKRPRMMILNSPNNPTGKIINKEKFHAIVELANKYGTLIVSDEVYDKYARSKVPSILDEEYKNSVYINSFSKRFGLTGWRIAYLVTSIEYAKRIKRIVQTALTCVPEFIQKAALTGMKRGETDAKRNRRLILRKTELTCRELDKIDMEFFKPDGAFYLFPRSNKPNFNSVEFATKLLKEKHISVAPGLSFGDYPAFFRLAVSLPERQIPRAIKSIGEVVENWS